MFKECNFCLHWKSISYSTSLISACIYHWQTMNDLRPLFYIVINIASDIIPCTLYSYLSLIIPFDIWSNLNV